MGTRSKIGMMQEDGSVLGIYCHWDGYLSHNGQILQDHYRDATKIMELMELGSLSVLGPEIGQKHNFENRAEGAGICTAYGRDRGEQDVDADHFPNVHAFLSADWGQEYTYLYAYTCKSDVPEWVVYSHMHDGDLLSDALANQQEDENR